jgi:hypothetical protein
VASKLSSFLAELKLWKVYRVAEMAIRATLGARPNLVLCSL